MKRKFLSLLVMIFGLYLAAQEPITETDPVEEALCREVASDLIAIYDNWDTQRDYNILYPRVKDFVEAFYLDFPDFNQEIIEKEKLGQEMTDYEKRAFVAYKAMKLDKIFEEVARFISTKDFYWGYISDDLDKSLTDAANKIKNYTISRKDELMKAHNTEVAGMLAEVRGFETKLDSMKKLTDLEIVNLLLDDSEYNSEMLLVEFKIDSLKRSGNAKEALTMLIESKDARILDYINKKKEEMIDDTRLDKIAAKEDWLERKRTTFFDIKEEESYRLNDLVSEYLIPMEEERKIASFDVTDEFIMMVHQDSPEAENLFKQQIKYKYYSGLISTFGSYVIFDKIPEFRTYRTNVLIGTFLFIILFFYIFAKVKTNKEKMFIRRIPGLDAIDDAVGRATEMGKPIIYDSGIGYQTQIETIASMLILRSVSKKVAEFKAEIYVPTCDPIVMQISEEMVASGFLDAGYPEDHKKDNIFFLAADQFAFAAGVAGLLSRKKPATAFHFGYYMAESLLISEAGFAAGAIQVAGTTQASQLPFFITACDYTLIGEELYAAAAYISRDAQIMTNLKLSDYAKITIGFLFIIGTILLTINSEWTFLQDLLFTR